MYNAPWAFAVSGSTKRPDTSHLAMKHPPNVVEELQLHASVTSLHPGCITRSVEIRRARLWIRADLGPILLKTKKRRESRPEQGVGGMRREALRYCPRTSGPVGSP